MDFVKRVLVSMLAGTAAITAGLASRAAFGLPDGPADGSAARAAVSAPGCNHDGVATTLRTAFDPATGYIVTAVTVDGIDGHCAGHELAVALTDAAGRVAAQGGPLPVPTGGGSVTVPLTDTLPVELAAWVHTLLD
jgi:hypothetical protein